MTSKMMALVAALTFAFGAAPAAMAAKQAAPKGHVHYYKAAGGKACKGEFMYMKGGKCQDARDKPASS